MTLIEFLLTKLYNKTLLRLLMKKQFQQLPELTQALQTVKGK
jgi:hypothetical protein